MVEQTLTRLLLILVIGVTLGLVLMPETVWDDGLRPIIWEPIQQDAGAQGDAGYSIKIRRFTPLACLLRLSSSKHCSEPCSCLPMTR